MKTKLRHLFVVVILVLMSAVVVMCGPDGRFIGEIGATKGVESRGEWKFVYGEHGNSQTGRMKITDDGTFDFWAEAVGSEWWVIKGTFEKFDNEKYNADATGEGDYGHLVAKINDGMIKKKDSSAIGEYVVVRWKNLKPGEEIVFAISKKGSVFDHRPTIDLALAELTTEENFSDWMTAKCTDPLTPPEEQEPIEIEGTWKASHGSIIKHKYTITVGEGSLKVVYDKNGNVEYGGKIVKYNNRVLNAGVECETNCGYAVVQLTEGKYVEGKNCQGKYAIFRWENLEGSTVDMVISNNGTDINTITTKDTVDGEDGAIEKLKYFPRLTPVWTHFEGATKQ